MLSAVGGGRDVSEGASTLGRPGLASAVVLAFEPFPARSKEGADFRRQVVPPVRTATVVAREKEEGRRMRHHDGPDVSGLGK